MSTPSGADAPYKIVKDGPKFRVKNNTGLTKATFETREAALAYQRALYANVPGAAKRADDTKFTGKARTRVPEQAAAGNPAEFLAELREIAANEPANPGLWSKCKAAAKAKFTVYPSAYANGWAVQEYKRRGGTWKDKPQSAAEDIFTEQASKDEGLGKWFSEKWVDISRTNPDGSHPACGRPTEGMSEADYRKAYPKCVPAARAAGMSDAAKKSASDRKRDASNAGGSGKGQKPKMVSTEKAAHDLVFFEKRSTPLVVSKGASPSTNSNYTEKYGKQTHRRAATSEEEAKISKGQWVQVDQSGKKSGEAGYKKTKYRPGLVQKSDEQRVLALLSLPDHQFVPSPSNPDICLSCGKPDEAAIHQASETGPYADAGGPVESLQPEIDSAGPIETPAAKLDTTGPTGERGGSLEPDARGDLDTAKPGYLSQKAQAETNALLVRAGMEWAWQNAGAGKGLSSTGVQGLPPAPDPTDEVATEHDGAMVCLVPEPFVAQALAQQGGEKATDLHVTLAYMPNDVPAAQVGRLASILQGIAHQHAPLMGELSGVGHFTAGEDPVTYVSVDVPGLNPIREQIAEGVEKVTAVASDHGYTPHMTLAYNDINPDIPNLKVQFSAIWLVIAGKRWSFPFTSLGSPVKARELAKVQRRKHPFQPILVGTGWSAPIPCAECGRPSDAACHMQSASPTSPMSPASAPATSVAPAAPAAQTSASGAPDDGTGDAFAQAITDGPLSDLDPSDVSPYLDEQSLIADNMRQPQSQMPHSFEAAAFTDAQGQERCVMCGQPKPDGTMCNPPETSKASEISRITRVVINELRAPHDGQLWSNARSPEMPRELAGPAMPTDERIKAFVTEANGKTILTAPAVVLDDLQKSMTPNQHFLWMAGNFVGAEKANRNGAFWSTKDLQMGEPTVKHGPLNWLHEGRHIIGSIADSRMVLPSQQQAADGAEPRITASAAIWKWIYPDEAKVVEQASDMGQLWYSMECISDTVMCVGGGACGQEIAYGAYMAGQGCQHMVQRASYPDTSRRFKDPIFLGGAVIVPPVRPGWADADATVMRQAASLAEDAFEQAGKPDMTTAEFERVVAGALEFARF